MFPWSTPSPLTRRARNALSLARSFLLLEDDYDVDWEVDLDEPGRDRSRIDAISDRPARERALVPHPHRTALRGRSARVRVGQPAQAPHVCLCPVESSSTAAIRRATSTKTGRPQAARDVKTGGVLLSQALASQVPSALRGLTALFGMGRGVSPSPIATGKRRETAGLPRSFKTAQRHTSITSLPALGAIKKIRQALDPLVPVSFGRYRPSRSGLSTWWSTRGLTPSRGWESSSRGRLPA